MAQTSPSSGPNSEGTGYAEQRTNGKPRPDFLIRAFLLAVLCLPGAARLNADTLTGTVKDPSGSAVTGARIEITGGTLSQPLVLTTDSEGKFSEPDLSAGKYTVRVSKDGFEDSVTSR